MARPTRDGIDYFPLDVNFLSDMKIRKIIKAHGAASVIILIAILSIIYREKGYYIKWDQDTCFLVADEVGASEVGVNEIVMKAIQVGFFHEGMYNQHKILTSSGIQKRYLQATERRINVYINPSFCIQKPSKCSHDADINGVSVCRSTQSKEKESKEKESKEKESKVNKSKVKERKEENISAPAPTLNLSKVNPLDKYFDVFGKNPSALVAEEIQAWREELSDELVLRAFELSLGKSFAYAKGVMAKWKQHEIATLEEAEQFDIELKKAMIRKQAVVVPEYYIKQKESKDEKPKITVPLNNYLRPPRQNH